jgi:hypothetical protein
MKRLAGALRDPYVASLAALSVLAIAALVGLGMAWGGVAGNDAVARELPFLVSGGFGGVGLLGFVCALLGIQVRRRAEARRRAQFDAVVRAAAGALDAVAKRDRLGQGA